MFDQCPRGKRFTLLPIVFVEMLFSELRHRDMTESINQMFTPLLVRFKCCGAYLGADVVVQLPLEE